MNKGQEMRICAVHGIVRELLKWEDLYGLIDWIRMKPGHEEFQEPGKWVRKAGSGALYERSVLGDISRDCVLGSIEIREMQ